VDQAATPPGPSRRRNGLIAVLATVLVLAVAVVGVVVVRPGPVAKWLGGGAAAPGASPDPAGPTPSPVLAPATTNAPMPTPAGVRAAIDSLVTGSGLGNRVNVAVADVATGQSLYDHGAAVPTVPASTTKLVTAIAALAARGPAYRITTRVVAGSAPGEVVLVGGGDPTLAANATSFYPGAARLDQLASQVKQALGGASPTKVTIDSTLYSGPALEPGWDADISGYGAPVTALMIDGARSDPKAQPGFAVRVANPDLAAGQAFARALGLPAAAVNAVARGTAPPPASATGTPTGGAANPAPGTTLGQVESPPMIRLVEFMLEHSDNMVAEALARQVALARGKPASFAGAAAATRDVLAELGLPFGSSVLADGSGLSRTNRIAPSLLVSLLALAGNGSRPELAGLFGGLPVGGWSGSLNTRYRPTASGSAAGAGVVRAKTGTLLGVNAISGVLTTTDGRLLAFAILADQVPLGQYEAQSRLDKIVGALASCGCR
jgi:D-alanyl-D-alanine carboxypeptidase/D-alanyl-D-alanine-endopeptidase (penicillin-binding protein 4)